MTNKTYCELCFKNFASYKNLVIHERNVHSNNKLIPHFYLLSQPTSEQIIYYINSFIVLLKKKLSFSRHAIGKKHLLIDTFPENVFIYLFKNEETFKYSPAKCKYQCNFEGHAGITRLNQLFCYNQWSYVLLEDYENKYQIKFTWSQTILSENNRELILERMNCNFITDSDEFQENSNNECKLILNKNENEISILPNSNTKLITKQFYYILPCPPLQNSNNNQ
ncbi:hypothetical protein Glove_521g41 [Diversispora epigaea]|uniref:C2H2-type domain-containing protein n=1 Tax=Diversispora epigaea TaxID=1348612 RepID=A0A397GEI0_9GLOM|nr:hypothetical protein Glove_521g41 [Diversispora epigaea]